jgi:hypothetical protein
MAEGGVALPLQLLQVLEDGHELLQGRDALVTGGGVGRSALDLEPEDERTALGRHEGETGRLGYEGGVGAVPAQDRRERPEPAVLLPHRGRDRNVAPQVQPQIGEGVDGGEVADEPALHVAGSASVEQVALDGAGERVVSPCGGVSRVDGVDVRVQEDGTPTSASPSEAGDVGAVLVGGLLSYLVDIGFHLFGARVPGVHLETALRESPLDDLSHRAFLACHRADVHQLLQQGHGFLAPGLHGVAYGPR